MTAETANATDSLFEYHTPHYCLHPYYGYVCTPNSTLELSSGKTADPNCRAIAVIDHEGFRNAQRPLEKPKGEIWIGLFGGSAAFSYAASSNETTIAGCLEKNLNEERAGRSRADRVRIVNFALPAGQQPQQSVIYLRNRHILDGVITFDGVNEIVNPAFYNHGSIPFDFPCLSHYGPLFGRDLTEDQNGFVWSMAYEKQCFEAMSPIARALFKRWHDRKMADLWGLLKTRNPLFSRFRSLFKMDRSRNREEALTLGADNWRRGIESMDLLRRATGADALYILQPVPENGKNLTDEEKSLLFDDPEIAEIVAWRKRGYPTLMERHKELAGQGMPCHAFTDIFADRTDTIYCDQIHVGDAGCRIVAQRITDLITKNWSIFVGA